MINEAKSKGVKRILMCHQLLVMKAEFTFWEVESKLINYSVVKRRRTHYFWAAWVMLVLNIHSVCFNLNDWVIDEDTQVEKILIPETIYL